MTDHQLVLAVLRHQGWSSAQLAAHLGIHSRTVRRWKQPAARIRHPATRAQLEALLPVINPVTFSDLYVTTDAAAPE